MQCRSCYKVVFVGDSASGKTSVLDKMFALKKEPELTVGCEFRQESIQVQSNCYVAVHYWDVGGSPRFRLFRDMYTKRAKLIFDFVDSTSACDKPYSDNTVFTKIDLIDPEKLSSLMTINPLCRFTSAITGDGIDELRIYIQRCARTSHTHQIMPAKHEEKPSCCVS